MIEISHPTVLGSVHPQIDGTAEEIGFERAWPAYASTRIVDELRATEYARLDELGQVYLDYTGGSLYAESQLRAHLALLAGDVFGNPHSKNPTSLAMTELVEHTRSRVLEHFNASPDEYVAIFTANATGALRLVGEAYPFRADTQYLLTADNHNSVNGIREFARDKGATVAYLPLRADDLRIDSDMVLEALTVNPGSKPGLFAFPAQSNFTGVQHPLEWIGQAQAQGWDVLVDAAAFAPTNRLDLGRWHPDFVSLSFYKIMGYPTGIGCLLARRAALEKLKRPWYAGGTITFSSVAAQDHYLTPGAPGFEDGTVNYLSIPAVEIGLRHVERVGLDLIHTRVMCLTGWLLDRLLTMRHSNGRPVVRLHGPADTHARGANLQVSILDRLGQAYDCYWVEQLANAQRISLRAGCHCNPGAREAALGFTRDDLAPCFRDKDRRTYAQFLDVIADKTAGAVRASLGIASNFADALTYARFVESFIDTRIVP